MAALLFLAGAAATAALAPATCRAATPSITSLSRSEAKVGASLIIKGRYFGASQGGSTVTFGERVNALGFAPCAKKARVISWSRSSIRVRVPGMAPGRHPVYVTVGRRASRSHRFTIAPLKTISNRTFTTASSQGNRIPVNTHDVLYENCTFTDTNTALVGTATGVLTMSGYDGANYNITFRNCTFTSNTGPGGGGDYGVNGVKIYGHNGNIHDLTFEGCTFGAMSRMGIELCDANNAAPFVTNVAIRDCTFEPVGTEAISLNQGDLMMLVDNCTIKGYGNDVRKSYIGAAIECNTTRFCEFRNSQIWMGYDAPFNLNNDAPGRACYLLFKDVDVDIGHAYQSRHPAGGGSMFAGSGLVSSLWQNCTFDCGDAANHLEWAGAAADWFGAGNDMSTSYITGLVSGYNDTVQPPTAAHYFVGGAPPADKLALPAAIDGGT